MPNKISQCTSPTCVKDEGIAVPEIPNTILGAIAAFDCKVIAPPKEANDSSNNPTNEKTVPDLLILRIIEGIPIMLLNHSSIVC